MANFIVGIISLTLGVVIMSGVFITTVKGVNTSNSTCFYANGASYTCSWTAGEIALWGLLTIAGIAGMVYGVMNVFGLA
jgi:hypothetical protein